jgi:hypothetical protein
MATYSLFDIGACNCTVLCPTWPCALSAANLNINQVIGTVNVSTTLVYSATCSWAAACWGGTGTYGMFPITAYTKFTIATSGGNTTYSYPGWNTVGCSGSQTGFGFVTFNSSGSVVSQSNYTSISYTCSPLNIAIVTTSGNFTITL